MVALVNTARTNAMSRCSSVPYSALGATPSIHTLLVETDPGRSATLPIDGTVANLETATC